MSIELSTEHALVLVGGQGSGKTRLAEEIAARHGRTVHVSGVTRGWLLYALGQPGPPLVLIFDEPTDDNVRFIKSMTSGALYLHRTSSGGLRKVRSAFVILTTNNIDALQPHLSDCAGRFLVLPIAEARRIMEESP